MYLAGSGFGAAPNPCTIESVASDGAIIFAGDCSDSVKTAVAVNRLARDNPTAYAQIIARQGLSMVNRPPVQPMGSARLPPGWNKPAASNGWKWALAGLGAMALAGGVAWAVRR